MKNTYLDLIQSTYRFPQDGFDLLDGNLTFNGVSLRQLIEKYGTPLRLTYLPKIASQIQKAKHLFSQAIAKYDYKADYYFSYCTKCNHYAHVVKKALANEAHLETSSEWDIELILNLYKNGALDTDRIIIHNGYKSDKYLRRILDLQKTGFSNSIIVLDSANELERLGRLTGGETVKIGLRMAINEEPQSPYYTSRLGIRYEDMFDFFTKHIKGRKGIQLKMLHFFVDSGIKDSLYYWGEFHRALELYSVIKKQCHTLDSFNLGGGFPIRNHLGFDYDYAAMVDEIIGTIKNVCTQENIPHPHIYTEFGRYTVGESGAILFKVLEQKVQNDTELWYIIDNSLLNTIPDAWGLHEKFLLLPVNKWNNEYRRINIGGISCDFSDYYNSEDLNQTIMLPKYNDSDNEPLYLGFFHTAAYQDAVSGYGGIKHCLIPSPRQVIIDRDENGQLFDYPFGEAQNNEEMFRLLGY